MPKGQRAALRLCETAYIIIVGQQGPLKDVIASLPSTKIATSLRQIASLVRRIGDGYMTLGEDIRAEEIQDIGFVLQGNRCETLKVLLQDSLNSIQRLNGK